jgi:hypothetical protein
MATPSLLHLSLPNSPQSITYRLHPVVVFSILDHFKRRGKDKKRVIGTLMGEKVGNVVYIRNCFPVTHSEHDDEVTLDPEYFKTMLSLHKRVNTKEFIVGWYSSGSEITHQSSLLHDLYTKEAETQYVNKDDSLGVVGDDDSDEKKENDDENEEENKGEQKKKRKKSQKTKFIIISNSDYSPHCGNTNETSLFRCKRLYES